MKNQDLLADFIDGNLSYKAEKKFCSYMKSDDELRSTLKQFCAIGIASQQASDLIPSDESKEGLYSKLGFKYKRRKPFGFFKFPNLDKSSSFLAGFVAALITTGAVLMAVKPDIFTAKKDNFIQNNASTTGSVSHPTLPSVSSGSKGSEKADVIYKTNTIYRNIYVKMKPDTVYIERKSIDESNMYTANIRTEKTPVLKPTNQEFFFPSHTEKENNNFLIDYYKPIGLSVEVRGSSYWNLPYTYIQPDKYMNFKNTSLAVFYNLADDFKIGAEVRQETFYQQFEDSVFQYEQQPNLLSGSVAFRYYPFEFGKFQMFTQVTAGFNEAGFVGRPMLGFEFKPYPDIGFMLGFEYSYLRFKQGNRDFNANKLGLHYGLLYSF